MDKHAASVFSVEDEDDVFLQSVTLSSNRLNTITALKTTIDIFSASEPVNFREYCLQFVGYVNESLDVRQVLCL